MNLKILSVIVLFVGFVHGAARPNIIYILADDLGIGDLGCYGQRKLKTPNIDRLAKEGMLFTNHYSGNTVCSPTRAVLMTGQHPGKVHCRGNGKENSFALDPGMTTMPRMFKNAGYATGAFGKWGLGTTSNDDASNPLAHGFDFFSGWKSQTIAHTYYPTCLVRNGKEIPLKEGAFVHDLIMMDAFQFVEKSIAAKKPFFCYIPTAIPHAAMHAPKELHDKWRKVYPQFDKKVGKYGAGPGEKTPNVVNPIAGFAAMMENLDNQIGELLDLLKERSVDENTVIIFSSDNGAHREGGHDPKFWNSNGPYRGIKRDLYEGGIHAPMLVRWPSQIKAGTKSDLLSAHWDVLSTLAGLIGEPTPRQSDGISMLPTFLGQAEEQKKHEFLYFEFIRGGAKSFTSRALRMGDWKAVQRSKGNKGKEFLPVELYELGKDIGEKKDLASRHAEKVKTFQKLMDDSHTPLK